MTDVASERLTNAQWQAAHAIARDLVIAEVDVNELGKAIAYLRSAINRDAATAGTQFFKFLATLVRSGNQIGHSGRTIGYYHAVDKACNTHLNSAASDAQSLLQILGWATRLMRYYKATPIGEMVEIEFKEQEITAVTERQAAIEELKSTQMFGEGQFIEAQVEKKQPKGSKVTYILGGVPFTEKEPKTFDQIPESGTVKVQIKSLKEDGSINHIKFAES
jgi:hypothetical protein